MARHSVTAKSFLTRLGRVEVRRAHFRCRSCGGGCFPPGRALGLEGDTVTPGMASVRGRQADGTSRSREAKLAVIYTAGTRRPARR